MNRNSVIDYSTFIPRVIMKRGMPVQMIFFVTSRCNCRCRHCFYWRKIEDDANRKEMTLDEIEKISKNRFNLLWLSLTGGEPFLRDDLADIAALFYRNSRVLNISIPTNGQLKEKILKTTAAIARECPRSYIVVIFSFDGLEGTHDRIRGEKTFTTASENFKALQSIQGKYRNLGVAAQITCTAENQKELKDVYAYLQNRLQPDNVTINLVRGDLRFPGQKDVDIRYYDELADLIKSGKRKSGILWHGSPLRKIIVARNFLTYVSISKIFKEKRSLASCYAGYLNCVIAEDGDVYPCEDFNLKIGNLREAKYDFRKLWYSSEAQKIRALIKKTACFCTYECAMSANALFNPVHYPGMLAELLKI